MKYQLHCPECHYEFTYDNGRLDENITRLGVEIQDITCQLAEHNLLPYDVQRQRTDWWRRTKKALSYKQKELAELKALRKVSDQQIKDMEYRLFKSIVKENVGEETYHKWLDEMTRELEAYKVSGLMQHEYTRAKSKSGVTSINKIR